MNNNNFLESEGEFNIKLTNFTVLHSKYRFFIQINN